LSLLDERTQRVEVDADFVVRTLAANVLRSMQAIAVLDNNGNPVGEYRYNGQCVPGGELALLQTNELHQDLTVLLWN